MRIDNCFLIVYDPNTVKVMSLRTNIKDELFETNKKYLQPLRMTEYYSFKTDIAPKIDIKQKNLNHSFGLTHNTKKNIVFKVNTKTSSLRCASSSKNDLLKALRVIENNSTLYESDVGIRSTKKKKAIDKNELCVEYELLLRMKDFTSKDNTNRWFIPPEYAVNAMRSIQRKKIKKGEEYDYYETSQNLLKYENMTFFSNAMEEASSLSSDSNLSSSLSSSSD